MDKQRIQINVDFDYGVTSDKNIQVPPMVFDPKTDPFDWSIGMAALQKYLQEFEGLDLRFLVNKVSVTWDILRKEDARNATIAYTGAVLERFIELFQINWKRLYFVTNHETIKLYEPKTITDFTDMAYDYRFYLPPEKDKVQAFMVDIIKEHATWASNRHSAVAHKMRYGPDWVALWEYSNTESTYIEWVKDVFDKAGIAYVPHQYFDSKDIDNLHVAEWTERKSGIYLGNAIQTYEDRQRKKRVFEWQGFELLEEDPIFEPSHNYEDVLMTCLTLLKTPEEIGKEFRQVVDNYIKANNIVVGTDIPLTENMGKVICQVIDSRSDLLKHFNRWQGSVDIEQIFYGFWIATDYFEDETQQEDIINRLIQDKLPEIIQKRVEYDVVNGSVGNNGLIEIKNPECIFKTKTLTMSSFDDMAAKQNPEQVEGAIWLMHPDTLDYMFTHLDDKHDLFKGGILKRSIVLSNEMPKMNNVEHLPCILLFDPKYTGTMFIAPLNFLMSARLEESEWFYQSDSLYEIDFRTRPDSQKPYAKYGFSAPYGFKYWTKETDTTIIGLVVKA